MTGNPAEPGHRVELIRNVLENIASAGERLKNTLFKNSSSASRLTQKLVGSTVGIPSCTFYHTADSIHIPWGLLFDRPKSGRSPADWETLSDTELADGFWCKKFDLTSLYTSSNSTTAAPDAGRLQLEDKYILGLIHMRARLLAVGSDVSAPWLDVSWPKESMFTNSSLRPRIEDRLNKTEPILLYFFGHSSNGELHIDDSHEPVLTPSQLRGLCADPRTRPGIFILNGCGTFATQVVEGNDLTTGIRLNWPSVINECGFHGLVGTEAKVPTRFAWALGRDLLYLMLVRGLSPAIALRELRSKHWPLSLLYGLYCDPRIAFSSTVAFLEESASEANYCDLVYSDQLDDSSDQDFRVLPFEGAKARRKSRL